MKVMLCILVMDVFMCNKKLSMDCNLKHLIENGVLIVIFDFSTPDHAEGHHVQDEAVRQEDEVHDVAPSGKEHHSNVVFINEILVMIIKKHINLTFLHYCNRSWYLTASSMS